MQRYYLNSRMQLFVREGTHTAYFPAKSVIMQVNSSGADLLRDIETNGIVPDQNNLQFLDTLSDLGVLTEKHGNEADSHETYINKNTSEYDFRTLTLFLTEKCNLQCIYCYADGGTGRRTMDYETALCAVEFMAEHCKKNNHDFHLAFHGSGEPSLSEELLRKIIILSEQLASEKKLKLYYSIGTNGVMSNECRKLLIDKEFDISLSIDGPEQIHNSMRPLPNGNSFQEAMKTADFCSKNALPFSVRTTVTEQNCGMLSDFTSFIFDNTSCEIIQLEPVYITGRALKNKITPPSIDIFIDQYFTCLDIASHKNKTVTYSGISYPETRKSFCQACGSSLCVKPDGSLTGCYESASKNPQEDPFFLGSIDNGVLNIDKNYYQKISEISFSKDKCGSCFILRHCGGDCPSKITGSSGQNNYRCILNRKLLEEYLLRHLENSGQSCIKFN